MSHDGLSRFKAWFRQPPELLVHWTSPDGEAEAWLVLNSLRHGAAGGGTRMSPTVHESEMINLAKTMEIKFAISGPPIGGGKNGIRFAGYRDPQRKRDVLRRWYDVIRGQLQAYYGTGGDLNISEAADVSPTLETLGIPHPQAGIVAGYFRDADPEVMHERIRALTIGCDANPDLAHPFSPRPTIADVATGWGVARATIEYFELTGESLEGKRALLQGFGIVGRWTAYFLAQAGVKIVGASSATRKRIDPTGLNVVELIDTMDGGELPVSEDPTHVYNGTQNELLAFLSQPADIFIPAAGSNMLDFDAIGALQSAGVKVLACGANNPFVGTERLDFDILQAYDGSFAIIPDFIANQGIARTFAFLMSQTSSALVTADRALMDIRDHVRQTMAQLLDVHGSEPYRPGLIQTGYDLALDRLGA